MNIENLSTLKINKLTQEQYNREVEAGRMDETALYLTPYDASDNPAGKSAYEVALDNGFEGTEEEWLESLKGTPGLPGVGIESSAINEHGELIITYSNGNRVNIGRVNGDKGDPGNDYTLTLADKEEIAHIVYESGVPTAEDLNNYVKKTAVYEATPNTLAKILSSAEAGATVVLSAGKYGLLTLTGECGLARSETDSPLPGTVLKYPENLTLILEQGVKIAGISITSGVMDNDLIYTTSKEKMKLPGNLTIRGSSDVESELPHITDCICLRNCVIDGLTIENCYITNGYLSFDPDSFVDYYGRDTTATAATVWHKTSAKPLISNIIINNNKFGDASISETDTKSTAILVKCVNNLEVYDNDIHYTPYNGIQVSGQSEHYSTGKIGVFKNKIRRSGSRSIRISALKDAELFIHSNSLNYANQTDANDECVKVSGCKNTQATWRLSNTSGPNYYTDDNGVKEISVDDGIVFENTNTHAIYNYDADTATLYITTV